MEAGAGDDQDISVLHVDDEPDFGMLTAEFLQQADDRIQVETTTSVDTALTKIETLDVDCIVSDYEMPNKDGLTLLKMVRESETNAELPFILHWKRK